MIKPAAKWFYWDWSKEAEALHGITPHMLKTKGIAGGQVLDELTRAVEGCRVYADSDLDSYWLETLAEGCGRALPFPVLYLGELFQEMRTNSSAIEKAEGLAITVELLSA